MSEYMVNMDINDLLNPMAENSGQDKSAKPSGNNHGDPNGNGNPDPNRGQKEPLSVTEDSPSEYSLLADTLTNNRQAVIQERYNIGAQNRSTTLSELGIHFQRFESPIERRRAKLIRDVFPGIMGSAIINEAKIMIIRTFKP